MLLNTQLDMLHQRRLLMDVQLLDQEFVQLVHNFYRLTACWLIKTAVPEYQVRSSLSLLCRHMPTCGQTYADTGVVRTWINATA